MTTENDKVAMDLRAELKFPAIGLQEYSADPAAQRRVGRIITGSSYVGFEPDVNAKPGAISRRW